MLQPVRQRDNLNIVEELCGVAGAPASLPPISSRRAAYGSGSSAPYSRGLTFTQRASCRTQT